MFGIRSLFDNLMLKSLIFVALCTVLAGCNLAQQVPTETRIPSETPAPSETAPPSDTPTATFTATATATATDTPTVTNTPTLTHTPTIAPTASITPQALAPFRFDQLTRIELPNLIANGIVEPLVVYTNSNARDTITSILTAQPENTVQTLYFSTIQGGRAAILEVDASTGNQIYIAPSGDALAYFQPQGVAPGLYIANLSTDRAFTGRVLQARSLAFEGILSEPAWSPDGAQLAVALSSGYSLDIFGFSRDGGSRTNLTNSGSYDMWPAWSPDGRYLAFVSDRATCPSWVPGEPDFCDALVQDPPVGGTVHLLELATGNIEQLSEVFVTEAPRWLNSSQLVIAGGDQTDLLNPQRTLWIANVNTGNVRQVVLEQDAEANDVLYLNDEWSPSGNAVIFQRVSPSDTQIIMMSAQGNLIGQRDDDLTFPRFGMRASWSPDNNRIVIGGTDGQCPYGGRIVDTSFEWITRANPPPSMCNPAYSPNGERIAFVGVTGRVAGNADGRADIYVAQNNGFGQTNLTTGFRGTLDLIGWIVQP